MNCLYLCLHVVSCHSETAGSDHQVPKLTDAEEHQHRQPLCTSGFCSEREREKKKSKPVDYRVSSAVVSLILVNSKGRGHHIPASCLVLSDNDAYQRLNCERPHLKKNFYSAHHVETDRQRERAVFLLSLTSI